NVHLARPLRIVLKMFSPKPFEIAVREPVATAPAPPMLRKNKALVLNANLVVIPSRQRERISCVPLRFVTRYQGLQPDLDGCGVIGPTMNGIPSATIGHGFQNPHVNKIHEERQRVEEVALSRGVAADEDRERFQRHVAE